MVSYFSQSVLNESNLCSKTLKYRKSSLDLDSPYVKVSVACRQHTGSTKANIFDKRPLNYFMDVGVWAGGPDGKPKTSFGLICGRDILLCSWMNPMDGGLSIERFKDQQYYQMWSKLSFGTRNFLDDIKNTNPERCYILAVAQHPVDLPNFTDDHDLCIILPDLHLHICRNGPLDRFQYGDGKNLFSLDNELNNLLMRKQRLARFGVNVNLIQAGDMYEIWESECVLRHLLSGLYFLSLQNREIKDRNDVALMLKYHLIPKELILTTQPALKAWENWLNSNKPPIGRNTNVNELMRRCIDISRTESIKDAIKNAHSPLFNGEKNIFDKELLGNHDNNQQNKYWSKHKNLEGFRNSASPQNEFEHSKQKTLINVLSFNNQKELNFFTKPGLSSELNSEDSERISLGMNKSIWVEHGHRWDWHNNNDDWSVESHGFDMVFKITRGWIDRVFSTGRSEKMTDIARSLADEYTEITDTEMRFPQLLRADQVIRKEEVQVVVMGHTHAPCLIEGGKGDSFFWSHPHATKYLNQKYILDEAKEFANELRRGKS